MENQIISWICESCEATEGHLPVNPIDFIAALEEPMVEVVYDETGVRVRRLGAF